MTEKEDRIRQILSGEKQNKYLALDSVGFEYSIRRRVIDEISKIAPNDVRILTCGKEVCKKDKEPVSEPRKFYGMHYVISGEGYLEYLGKKVKISAGSTFTFFPEKEVVTFYPDEKNPWSYIYLEYSGLLAETIVRDLGIHGGCHIFNVGKNSNVADAFFKLYEAFSMTGDTSWRTYAALYNLFAEFKDIQKPKKIQNETLKERYVRQAFDYMRNNLGNFTAEDVAKNCFVSTAYLTSVCKQVVGLSLKQCITVYSLLYAKNFLRMTNTPISKIAARYGCSEARYFSKVFKKYFGVSPTEYRKRAQSLQISQNHQKQRSDDSDT